MIFIATTEIPWKEGLYLFRISFKNRNHANSTSPQKESDFNDGPKSYNSAKRRNYK